MAKFCHYRRELTESSKITSTAPGNICTVDCDRNFTEFCSFTFERNKTVEQKFTVLEKVIKRQKVLTSDHSRL